MSCYSSRPYPIIPLLSILCFSLILSQLASASEQVSNPGCSSTCGNLTIPYPFGIGNECARKNFDLTCNHSFDPAKTFIGTSTIEVLNISLNPPEARVKGYRAYDCYSKNISQSNTPINWANEDGPYTLSNVHNKFTVLGCDTDAYIYGNDDTGFTRRCPSMCDRFDQVVNGSCSGVGCCQISIPKGLKYYKIEINNFPNHTEVSDFNPCSYAFLVDQDWFKFRSTDITKYSVYRYDLDSVPVVLDWVAGNELCEVAKRNSCTFACRSENSYCYDSFSSATGYLCNCSSGYEGNPYLVNGCQDIDECKRPDVYPCEGVCVNILGTYTRTCPKGLNGNATAYGCRKQWSINFVIGISCGSGGLLLVICVGLIHKRSAKKSFERKKERHFKENYDILLQRQILCSKTFNVSERIKFFTLKDLEKATNKFDKSRIVGIGGHGTVYKGLLDLEVVAIKRSKVNTKFEIEQFINEVILLSHIRHRNVVKFIGCCFETEVPLIVYEFISNGTLFEHLINPNAGCHLSWDDCVRIATKISSALSYMHSEANVSIFHRDVKSSNILLDERLTTKVSDFRASRTIMVEETHISTCVQGTIGYLDPEYMHTGQLIEKSDVYSLGVIIMELITGKKASSRNSEDGRNLASYFISTVNGDNLTDLVDSYIVEEVNNIELQTLAELAIAGMRIRGKDRPTMKEMEQILEGVMNGKRKKKHN